MEIQRHEATAGFGRAGIQADLLTSRQLCRQTDMYSVTGRVDGHRVRWIERHISKMKRWMIDRLGGRLIDTVSDRRTDIQVDSRADCQTRICKHIELVAITESPCSRVHLTVQE